MKPPSTWRRSLKKITGCIPDSIGQALFERDIVLFFYHIISDGSLPHINHLYSYKSRRMFEHDLFYLLNNYTFISYEQLVAHHQGRIPSKPNSVFISFDDGFRECYDLIRPLLLEYKIPCAFFISTDMIDNQNMDSSPKISLCIEKVIKSDETWKQAAFARISQFSGQSISNEQRFIDWIKPLKYSDCTIVDQVCDCLEVNIVEYLKTKKPYMTLEEIQRLVCDGFTIGAHTKSHPLLSTLPEEKMEIEIVESCRFIQEITKAENIPFAFPFYGNGVRREIVKKICSRNNIVGYIFDSSGLWPHKGPILGRIWADAPELSECSGSTLPGLLHSAYQDLVVASIRNIIHFPN